MSNAEMLASALSGGLQNKVSAAFDVDKEAAAELRRIAADNEQMRNDLLTAKDALSLLERYEYASATIALRIALFPKNQSQENPHG